MTDKRTITVQSFTIPRPIADYCRKAAEALGSSEAMLRSKIDFDLKIDPDGDGEIVIHRDELAITADNMRNVCKWLRFLAEFDEGGDA